MNPRSSIRTRADEDASTYARIGAITTPTLILNAADDPICSADGVAAAAPAISRNPHVIAVVTRHGGHVAWAQGWGRPARSWDHDAVVEDVGARLARRGYVWDAEGAPALPLALPPGAAVDGGAPVTGDADPDERVSHLEA